MATRLLPAPLSDAFFSEFNRETLHRSIIDAFKTKTGHTIERQNDSDLQALMRRVYADIARDPYNRVREQVDAMNARVIKEASATISTGVLQQLVYMRDITSNPIPLPSPISTSTYGNKLPYNTKVTL
jgi:hypothetical protein